MHILHKYVNVDEVEYCLCGVLTPSSGLCVFFKLYRSNMLQRCSAPVELFTWIVPRFACDQQCGARV